MKKLVSLTVIFVLIFSLSACSKMPFNGEIDFNEISLTIPERFIRDSTQSNDDFWVFEHDNYSEYILISRKDITGDVQASLEAYADYMKENGAESEIISFLDTDAVFSTYYKDDMYCQELLFPCNNSFYSVALRGGNESGFEEITATITFTQSDNKNA